jgi:L-alanine-DL-glutamate epimerase-like enolase superfamily enzyme
MKIQSVEVFPCRLPFRGAFQIAGGAVGRPGDLVPHVFVRLRDDDGFEGWGEARPSRQWSYETEESVTTTLRNYLAPALLGQDVFDVANVHRILARAIMNSVTAGQPIAKSALDTALHDLICHRLKLTLRKFLGANRGHTITLSWTVTGATVGEMEQSVQEGLRAGYHHFNFKLGISPRHDLEAARMLRKQLPHAFLWADANQAYDVTTAVAMGRALSGAGIDVFEQPLKAGNLLGLRELRQKSSVPIAVDEPLCDPEMLLTLIRMEAIDVFVLKIARSGGIGPSRRMIELAQTAGLRILGSGLTESRVNLAACAQLLAGHGIADPAALNGPQFLGDDVVAGGVTIKGDHVELSDAPGLGLTIDPAKIEKYLHP